MPDGEDAERPRRASAPMDTVRAGVIVVCFVVALVLLLGPASSLTASPPTTTPTTHPTAPIVKSTTTVQVANGTTATGVARSYRQTLVLSGWDALTAEDLTPPATTATQARTTYVYFLPGRQGAAKLIAAELSVPSAHVVLRTQKVLHTVSGAARDDVVVILGTDLAH